MAEKVTLFVYDLSQGMARNMSLGLVGRQIGKRLDILFYSVANRRAVMTKY
jgi:hypothetical protein